MSLCVMKMVAVQEEIELERGWWANCVLTVSETAMYSDIDCEVIDDDGQTSKLLRI